MMIGFSLSVVLGFGVIQKEEPSVALAKALNTVPQIAKDPINHFGVDTVLKMSHRAGGKNFMISPWSVQECVGMVRLGARGETDKELANFLKQPGTWLQSAMGQSQLRAAAAPLFSSGQIRQANAIWLRKGFDIQPKFTSHSAEYFDVRPETTTFPNPGLKLINTFVSNTTRGKIPKLFDQLESDTRMVLVNAISFVDKWAVPFKKADTKELPFNLFGKSVKNVPTMTARGEYSHGKNSECEYVSLPYKSGLKMLIVLPYKGVAIAKVLAQPNFLKSVSSSLRSEPGSIFIPRWKSEFSWDLKTWMKQQGAKSCFEPAKADFSGISKQGLFIGQAIQKTFIKVDEEGTEAAAATGITMRPTSARVDPPFEFRADRPFAYFIWAPNGVVYFAGVVNNPAGS